MTLRACLVLEDGDNIDAWGYLLRAFAVSEVFVLGRAPKGLRATPALDASALPGALVVVSPREARRMPGLAPLSAFTHPEDATYLFGADNSILDMRRLGRVPDASVYVDTPDATELHAHVAAGIVFHDRLVRHG